MNEKLEACIDSALAGGFAALNCVPLDTVTKESSIGSIHAIVSESDYESQKAILEVLKKKDKTSFFMTEEDIGDEDLANRFLDGQNLERMKGSGVYIIDELDGSSSHNTGHYEWSISVGYVESLVHKAGAVFAPQIFGKGALFYSSSEEGAFMRLNEREDQRIEVINRDIRDSYVIFGADCVLKNTYPKHFELMGKLSDDIRTTNMNGSCALPLSLVAAGKADSLVQPLQSVWDYAAGMLILQEAGGEIMFYEMDGKGDCFYLEELELMDYNPSTKNVGFIAGNKRIVPFIADKLFE